MGSDETRWLHLVGCTFTRILRRYTIWVRIDDFIGFASFWEIPAGEETAVNGYRVEAPGFELFDTIKRELGDLNIIAEDLGLRDGQGHPIA